MTVNVDTHWMRAVDMKAQMFWLIAQDSIAVLANAT